MENVRVTLGASRERPGWTSGGDLITYVDIPFTVDETGSSAMVSIPTNQFSAELMVELVQSKANEIVKAYKALGK